MKKQALEKTQPSEASVKKLTVHSGKSGSPNFSVLENLLTSSVRDGAFPAVEVLVGRQGEVLFHQARGHRWAKGYEEHEDTQAQINTVFDIGELTNVLVTTAVIAKLIEAGKLSFGDRVTRYVQGFGVNGKAQVTIGHLLSHTSGLAPSQAFYEELTRANTSTRMGILASRGSKDYMINSITRSHLKYETGSKQVYSELGFILLGHIIETLTGLTLETAARRLIFQPIGLKSTSYVDLALIKQRKLQALTEVIAPTEDCPWRRKVICGEVHDENAWSLGGVAGHSGIFSTAIDLHKFATEMFAAQQGRSEHMDQGISEQLWQGPSDISDKSHLYGWGVPCKDNNLLQSRLSSFAVGMNSRTGCAMWLEPKQEVDIIILSNSIHLGRGNKKLKSLLPELCDAVLESI